MVLVENCWLLFSFTYKMMNSSLDNTKVVAYLTCLGWRIWWYESAYFSNNIHVSWPCPI
jgi:hypothetical protein